MLNERFSTQVLDNLLCYAYVCFCLLSEQQITANCADTIAFVEELTPNDPLIKGVPDDKNPYKGDKGGCVVTQHTDILGKVAMFFMRASYTVPVELM